MQTELLFSKPQLDFVTSTHLITAFAGGWGSGKTFGNLHLAIQNRLRVPLSKYSVVFLEPSHSLLESAAYPTLFEILPSYGLEIGGNCTFIGNPKVLTIDGFGSIRFGSLTDASKITAANNVSIHIDECDRIAEKVTTEAFNQIPGRLRIANKDVKYFKDMCRVAFSSTPEGFKFLYKHFDKTVIGNKYPERKLIKASIHSNLSIDVDDFVKKLDHLTPEMKKAYIDGEFVNMQSGSVYKYFNRDKHVIEPITIEPNTMIYIGCDFNIQHMACVLAVKDDDGNLIIFDEIVDAYDTFALIQEIRNRIGELRYARIYPDASGRNRYTGSRTSNIDLLMDAGFRGVLYDESGNPFISDTVNKINLEFKSETGKIRITKNCHKTISAIEQQTYTDKGEPDKSSGIDHVLDAVRYLIWHGLDDGTRVISGYHYR
tara:strand:+ start:409 stop:1698 length:1290 start_codon:yes stop_codon:yes gene_type:complete